MSPAVRVGAAETMAVIIDDDPDLQELASYTDQLLVSLADYLKPLPSVASSGGPSAKNMSGWTALHKKVPSYTVSNYFTLFRTVIGKLFSGCKLYVSHFLEIYQ